MSYPRVLFLREDKYQIVDEYFEEECYCEVYLTSDVSEAWKAYSNYYHVIVLYGDTDWNDKLLDLWSDRLERKTLRIHRVGTLEKFVQAVNTKYMVCVSRSRENLRPQFSIFTTCYNSFWKMERAYRSLAAQRVRDWEWVVVDDSPDPGHFDYLRVSLVDPRIRLYKRSRNSGSIGEVKNEAVSLCRGKYVVELDHDDELTSNCLEDALREFEEDEDVGFIYMDFINMANNGAQRMYGDYQACVFNVCNGYGGYLTVIYNGVWHYQFLTPNINNMTASALPCCPNHPRIWRASVLREVGGYSEHLPVGDDYEVLLRTFASTKCSKICKVGYVQYIGDGGKENFSLLRNAEINRLCPYWIKPAMYESMAIDAVMNENNGDEEPQYAEVRTNIWKRAPPYEHRYINKRVGWAHYVLVMDTTTLLSRDALDECRKEDTYTCLISAHEELKELQLAAMRSGLLNIGVVVLRGCSAVEIERYVRQLVIADDAKLTVFGDE